MSAYFSAVSVAVPIYFLWLGGQQIAKRVWPQRDSDFAAQPQPASRIYGVLLARANDGRYWHWLCGVVLLADDALVRHLVADECEIQRHSIDVPFPFLSPLRTGHFASRFQKS